MARTRKPSFSRMSESTLKQYIKTKGRTANSRIDRLKQTDLYFYNRAITEKWDTLLTLGGLAGTPSDTYPVTSPVTGKFRTATRGMTREELQRQAEFIYQFLTEKTTVQQAKIHKSVTEWELRVAQKQAEKRTQIAKDLSKKVDDLLNTSAFWKLYTKIRSLIPEVDSHILIDIIISRWQSGQSFERILTEAQKASDSSTDGSEALLKFSSDKDGDLRWL